MLLSQPLALLLLNFVILATKAQQPPPPPLASIATNVNNQPQLAGTTRSPLLLLTRLSTPATFTASTTTATTTTTTSTTAQPELNPSTANFFPSNPPNLITIDVSQPPNSNSFEGPQVAATTAAIPQNELSEQLPSTTAKPTTAAVAFAAKDELFAPESVQPVNVPPPADPASGQLRMVASNRNSQPNPQTDLVAGRSSVDNPPLTASPSQPIEPVRPLGRIEIATQSRPITTFNNTVQLLRARAKFKCKDSSDCLNGGLCHDGSCLCKNGYTGESCSINIDECRQVEEPCQNNGRCIDDVASFRCECAAGFKGEFCQEAIDMCINSPCLNEAKCINHRTNYTCECEPGWEGKNCETNINECLKNACRNNGTCYDLINDYRCDCGKSGFTGKDCEIDIDDCASKPCGNGTKECKDLTGGFKCICFDGWQGELCDKDVVDCDPNPCENGGICKEKALILALNSTERISHELVNMSEYAGYTCECKEEFYGDKCQERKKCYTKPWQELCNHQVAECVSIGSSYECLINASFDGTGTQYAYYKTYGETKLKEIYVKYRSLVGGSILGIEINQHDLTVDLVLNKSGPFFGGSPVILEESSHNPELLLDGNEREIKLIIPSDQPPLEFKSVSLARSNDYVSPFKGCIMQVRVNNVLLPFLDHGQNMKTFELSENHLAVGQCHTCFENDCHNGGTCKSYSKDGSNDHCECSNTGYMGHFCETDINECNRGETLCENGGTCENTEGSFKCRCKEGYKGNSCREISDFCKAKQPCGSGTCKNLLAKYQCDCPSSHVGRNCERKRDCVNECHIGLHAQCINNVTCACLPGRKEERSMCEFVSSCEQVQGELCLNGGTCKNLESGGYHCVCPDPYHGPICQYLVEKPQFDLILLIVVACVGFLMAACAVVSLVIFRSVRKARATRGTYSPSTQEKFGNSASDLLKPPQPERLI